MKLALIAFQLGLIVGVGGLWLAHAASHPESASAREGEPDASAQTHSAPLGPVPFAAMDRVGERSADRIAETTSQAASAGPDSRRSPEVARDNSAPAAQAESAREPDRPSNGAREFVRELGGAVKDAGDVVEELREIQEGWRELGEIWHHKRKRD